MVLYYYHEKWVKNSKSKISYNTYTGFQETSRTLPMLNATEYALLLNESYANGGNAIPFPNVSGLEEEQIGKMRF
jgi:hypothetical protein